MPFIRSVCKLCVILFTTQQQSPSALQFAGPLLAALFAWMYMFWYDPNVPTQGVVFPDKPFGVSVWFARYASNVLVDCRGTMSDEMSVIVCDRIIVTSIFAFSQSSTRLTSSSSS
jgi:hypothetical protein